MNKILTCAMAVAWLTCTQSADVVEIPFSRYPLDGDFLDTAPAGNNLTATFEPSLDSVCDGSLRLEERTVYKFANPKMVPTGSASWTMSVYAKCIKSGDRTFMHLGGDDPAFGGIGFGIDSSERLYLLDYHNKYVTYLYGRVISIYDWHHYAVTYNGATLKLYVDEKEAGTQDVALDLLVSSTYGTMSIGDHHSGGTDFSRFGTWLLDEAVFARGVVDSNLLRAPCVQPPPVLPPA